MHLSPKSGPQVGTCARTKTQRPASRSGQSHSAGEAKAPCPTMGTALLQDSAEVWLAQRLPPGQNPELGTQLPLPLPEDGAAGPSQGRPSGLGCPQTCLPHHLQEALPAQSLSSLNSQLDLGARGQAPCQGAPRVCVQGKGKRCPVSLDSRSPLPLPLGESRPHPVPASRSREQEKRSKGCGKGLELDPGRRSG